MDEFEAKIADACKNLDGLKTPSCLDITTIGRYAENKLSAQEMTKAEAHIHSCLYCLGQLTEIKELLYIQSEAPPVSPGLEKKLNGLFSQQKQKATGTNGVKIVIAAIEEVLAYPFIQWRYSMVSLASICVTITISYFLLKPDSPSFRPPVDLNSFVIIRAIGSGGEILNEAQGFVVSSHGLVASSLNQLSGATSIQIKLRDGSTYSTRNIWKDEDKNLAVMKIGKESIPPVQMADVKEISVGEYAYVLVDPAYPAKGFNEAVVSDFKRSPGRHRGEELQYIQIATLTTTMKRGALVDKNGRIIGLLMTQEKNINLAVPLGNVEKMVSEQKAIPVSELGNVTNSTEALHYYIQAILAEDAEKWDQAIVLVKQAIDLNPKLEVAHMLLGGLYYYKRLYEQEAAEYEAVLRINPKNLDAIASLAASLETRGYYKQAIEEYKKVIAADPEDQETLYNLGVAYIADGQPHKAMEIYPKLKALSPGDGELLKRLATGKRR